MMQKEITTQTMSLYRTARNGSLFLACLVLLFTASLLLSGQARGEDPKTVKCPYLEGKSAEGKGLCMKK